MNSLVSGFLQKSSQDTFENKKKLDVARNQILADEAFQGQEWVFQGHTVFQEHIQ